jgi:NAD(P)H-hydrate epimerase
LIATLSGLGNYSTRTLLGHTSTHAPHSAHESSTVALSSLITIASRGHAETHSPQPVHLSASTFTAIIALLECLRKSNENDAQTSHQQIGILAMFANFAREGFILPPRRLRQGDKGTYGTVLGIGGSRGMAGSVAMAGRGALLTGAGLVRLAVPDPILETVAGYSPEPTTIPCPADKAGRFAFGSLELLLAYAENCTALFFGPGLGRSDELDRLVPQFLQKVSKPVVVDADALNALSVTGMDSLDCSHQQPIILTPHAGEFTRLRNEPTPPEENQENRQSAALEFARRFGVLLVLKGHETIITDGQRLTLNSTGNPGMATGGSGDVLTGMIAALIAQNFSPVLETVRLAVYLHGFAGDIAAEHLGEESVTATAILDAIPNAFARGRMNEGH